ncbi:ABC transporter substrate-binding protein [Agrobacterium larrymoorei]|uniref:ABC transporter substrate-binding protein n=1 Tax=Agrobacterium larrymoorei TaxID=160699 RepID=UPI0015723177|nr:ABC transporter substrate-binding protein [Agrobacterium larrymoorei]NTJ41481.1 ABC transporter substrate-binding protein [Agrobacterium larrymoorei]
MIGSRRFKAAFSPTVDCAILVVALEKGFAADEGIGLELIRKNSAQEIMSDWADEGLNGAHLPASLPVASALGLLEEPGDLVSPFVLSTGGAVLAVSQILHDDLFEQGMKIPDAGSVSRALSRVALARNAAELPPLTFAIEHVFSPSVYELRYLLASARLLSPRDVTIIETAPADMPGLLAEGVIDGFYVAEPYGSAVALRDSGRVVTTKSHIWQNAPEKVLAVSRGWIADNEATLHALLRALYHAGEWCAAQGNIEELAGLLAAPQYLATEGDLVLPALTGFIPHSPSRLIECPRFFATSGGAANFPWQSQALWFFNQMIRWGDCHADYLTDVSAYEAASQAYRPDIFRSAMRPIFAPVPSANMKLEGTLHVPVHVGASRSSLLLGPDAFFDGKIFDPEKLENYDES